MVDREDSSSHVTPSGTTADPHLPADASAQPSRPAEASLSVDHQASSSPSVVLPTALTPASGPAADEDSGDFVPARVGCRTDLRGWAGAHLHGAVRPRRRAAGRGRPPGRWC
jgi:hypothetical protein